MCAFLSSWTSIDTLLAGAAAGHFFENYAVGQILRNYAYSEEQANLNYYRDTNQKEIDIIVEEGGVLHPIEVKMGTSPDRRLVRAFNLLAGAGRPLGNGGVICMAPEPFPIDMTNCLIPAGII